MNDDLIRSQFEYWAAPQGLRLHRRDMAGSARLGQYCSDNTQLAFEAFRAALSHAAGQEVDYSAKFRHAGEWSRYQEGTRAHDIDGGFWLKIDRQWKWMPDGGTFPTPAASAFDVSVPAVARNDTAPPTTSAEVGRDAERYRLLRDRTLKKSVSDGRDDGPFIATGNILRGFSVPRYPDLEIDQALAASSGRQGG